MGTLGGSALNGFWVITTIYLLQSEVVVDYDHANGNRLKFLVADHRSRVPKKGGEPERPAHEDTPPGQDPPDEWHGCEYKWNASRQAWAILG